MTLTMDAVLRKTELGRAEISRRSESLSRHERNMLVVADGQRRAGDLLDLIGTENHTVLMRLIEAGLLEIVGLAADAVGAARAPAKRSPHADIAPELDIPFTHPANATPQHRLYAFLGAQIPAFFSLGAIALTFKLERANSLDELRPVFDKLLAAVEHKRGAEAARLYRERYVELTGAPLTPP